MRQLADEIERHLFGHILPFWAGPALDEEQGGWLPWMSNDLQVDRTQPKGLIVHSRILWAFSAAYRARPCELYRRMADRAFEFVMDRFWDPKHGGALWRLNSSGEVIDDSKKTYGQAFYIYALAEYHLAFQAQAALERSRTLFELLERHARDPLHGGYWEVLRRDWSEAPDSRLSDKDMNEKKSMNNHLHVLEGYTNLCRAWNDVRPAGCLREALQLFPTRILDSQSRHLHHFFNEAWEVRSNTYTFGHDIEASWLLCEAAELLGDAALVGRMNGLALEMTDTVLNEAVDADGGLFYEGKGGQIIDHGKECWPQAEALVGFLNALQISGDEKYLQAARGVWGFIQQHLVDRERGEWFWRINPDGLPDPTLPKVSEWKGPYHGTRACLEAVRRLRELADRAHQPTEA